MTPEEAEAFRAALENLLREHNVRFYVTTDETIAVCRPMTGHEVRAKLIAVDSEYDLKTVTVVVRNNPHPDSVEPLPSQAPGRISPDTPW